MRRQIFSTSENSCHSLHEYCNLLIFKLSPCNDKQKCHVTDVTFAIEWHQWHAKNKHIARGNADIQRLMTSVQWVQWDWESKLNDKYIPNISCDLLIFLLLSRFTCGLEYEFYLMFFFSFLTRQRYISWQKQKKTIVLQNKQLTTNVICWIIPIFGMLQIATDIFRKRLALFQDSELRHFIRKLEWVKAFSFVLYICTSTYTAKGVSCFFLSTFKAVEGLLSG